jgi:hypothetical protein
MRGRQRRRNACHAITIITENLEKTYYFSLFLGKKQHFILKTTSYRQNFAALRECDDF